MAAERLARLFPAEVGAGHGDVVRNSHQDLAGATNQAATTGQKERGGSGNRRNRPAGHARQPPHRPSCRSPARAIRSDRMRRRHVLWPPSPKPGTGAARVPLDASGCPAAVQDLGGSERGSGVAVLRRCVGGVGHATGARRGRLDGRGVDDRSLRRTERTTSEAGMRGVSGGRPPGRHAAGPWRSWPTANKHGDPLRLPVSQSGA
jgi:hypothetical protein